MRIVCRRRDPAEVHEACDYYDEQSPGLGDQFFEELTELIGLISTYPERWHPVREGDPRRKALLKRFPYAVIYEERLDHLKILIVRRHARRPGYGERRR